MNQRGNIWEEVLHSEWNPEAKGGDQDAPSPKLPEVQLLLCQSWTCSNRVGKQPEHKQQLQGSVAQAWISEAIQRCGQRAFCGQVAGDSRTAGWETRCLLLQGCARGIPVKLHCSALWPPAQL